MTTTNNRPKAPLDADGLPTTQRLIIELLVARRRLGSTEWTFTKSPSMTKALDALDAQGWFTWTRVDGPYYEVRLSDDGFRAATSPEYLSPLEKAYAEQKVRLDELEARAVVWDNTPTYTPPFA